MTRVLRDNKALVFASPCRFFDAHAFDIMMGKAISVFGFLFSRFVFHGQLMACNGVIVLMDVFIRLSEKWEHPTFPFLPSSWQRRATSC